MKQKKKHKRYFLASILILAGTGWLGGCGAPMGNTMGMRSSVGAGAPNAVVDSEFGATQGGVQDLAFARSLLAEGKIPPPEALTVQGAFSEYDLPLAGTACERLLCLRGATGSAADLGGNRSLWVQIGMSSNLNPKTWRRPAMSLILVVDVSGSMAWTYGRNGQGDTPGDVADVIIRQLAEQLGDGDRVALVTFGSSVRTEIQPSAFDRNTLVDTVDSMATGGGTDMESGLRKGYVYAYEEANAGYNTRILLFTDEQPNIGATDASHFGGMVRDGSQKGVGITVFGLGQGLGASLMLEMSQIENANAFSLSATEQVAGWYEGNWPWAVSPLAFNLEVSLTVPDGYRIGAAYGIAADSGRPEIAASTVFLSQKKGAILLRYDPLNGTPVAADVAGILRYETAADRSVVEQKIDLAFAGDNGTDQFDQPSVGTTQMIAVGMQGMAKAVGAYQNRSSDALSQMQKVVDWFAAKKSRPNAFQAGDELSDMAQKIYELMGGRAKTGDMYGEVVR